MTKNSKFYKPSPIDTGNIVLPPEILDLTELLANNTHEIWAKSRFAEGWMFGNKRNDDKKEHPNLVPYEELSESEKEFDRLTALETLKMIMAMGYKITK